MYIIIIVVVVVLFLLLLQPYRLTGRKTPIYLLTLLIIITVT